ncbi:MAG: hypothetical protein KDK45_19725, partial [Leptospiraceae bacterium]|nr:hypothetical protein [Leptospiraceae bacterium]
MKRRNIQFYSFLIILSSFISCIDSIRYSGIKKELSLESVDTAYCQKDEELGYVSYIIRSEIGSSSWAEFHKPLLASNSQNDKDRSLRVLKARAILAKCAVLLFEAIPTGSARDISSIINLESALKDIDMSVSYKNLETAKDWLKDRVEEPDRAIELSLLLDPIDILSCRAESKDKVESCVQEDVLTTSKIILLNEKKMRERHLEGEHTASESSLKQLCSANFTLPEPKSPATEIFSVESGKEYKGFLQKNAIDPLSPKAVRFYAIFLALKDSAYYMQSGSIRTW